MRLALSAKPGYDRIMEESSGERSFELRATSSRRALAFSVAIALWIAAAAIGSTFLFSSIAQDFSENPLYMAPILLCVALSAWIGGLAYGRLAEFPARFRVDEAGLELSVRGAPALAARWDELPTPRIWRAGSGGKPEFWVALSLPGRRTLKLRASASEWEAGCPARALAEEIARRSSVRRRPA
jgi:hypothetical protein